MLWEPRGIYVGNKHTPGNALEDGISANFGRTRVPHVPQTPIGARDGRRHAVACMTMPLRDENSPSSRECPPHAL